MYIFSNFCWEEGGRGWKGGALKGNMAARGLPRLLTRNLFDMSSGGDTVFALSSGHGKCGQ